MHLSTLVFGGGLVSLALATYGIQDDYSGNNFLNMFTFDTEDDPTHGYVNYVDANTAQQNNFTNVENGIVTIRSDSTSVASGRGRNSVRLTSKAQYTHGLVVLDLQHMPGSACGIWPAFWMTGPSWPNSGEIDIIEGVSYQSENAMTMHTSSGCSMVNKDCQGNTGCGVVTGGSASYGDGFNNANGGVYAMEWTSDAINIWFFGRNSVPNGATGDAPDPTTWGNPIASFQGGSGCNIDQHFQNNNIVFDTTFCGDWAGQVWSQDATCSSKAATCQDYVANNPAAFTEAYWTINSLKVYSQGAGSASAPSPTPAPAPSPRAVVSVVPINPPASEPTTSPAPAPSPSTTTAAAPSSEPTSTLAGAPPPSPTSTSAPPEYTGNVGIGSSTPDGPLGANPVTGSQGLSVGPNGQVVENPIKARGVKADSVMLSFGSDGLIEETPLEARDVKADNETEVEGPFMNERVVAGGAEEMHVKRGKVMRHLRRHQMDFGVRMHKH